MDWSAIGIGIFLVLTFLYAFLIAGQLVAWFFLLLTALFLHLAVRLVRAVETIAENSKRPETDADE